MINRQRHGLSSGRPLERIITNVLQHAGNTSSLGMTIIINMINIIYQIYLLRLLSHHTNIQLTPGNKVIVAKITSSETTLGASKTMDEDYSKQCLLLHYVRFKPSRSHGVLQCPGGENTHLPLRFFSWSGDVSCFPEIP